MWGILFKFFFFVVLGSMGVGGLTSSWEGGTMHGSFPYVPSLDETLKRGYRAQLIHNSCSLLAVTCAVAMGN